MRMNPRCLKYAVPAGIILWALILWPVFAQPVYLDVCLSMTGNRAQARAAIRVLGLDKEMLQDISEGGSPNVVIVGYNHHVAIDIWERPILVFGVYGVDENGDSIEITSPVFAANPIMRIRFISAEARAKAKTNIIDNPGLPAGLEKVECPTTRVWAGG